MPDPPEEEILSDPAPLLGLTSPASNIRDYVHNRLYILTCEIGSKMMPNVELSFQTEIKGK